MSIKKKAMAAIAAVSLAVVPTMAAASPAASKLSVRTAKVQRAGSTQTQANQIGGGTSLVAIIAAIAVAIGIAVAASGSDSP